MAISHARGIAKLSVPELIANTANKGLLGTGIEAMTKAFEEKKVRKKPVLPLP